MMVALHFTDGTSAQINVGSIRPLPGNDNFIEMLMPGDSFGALVPVVHLNYIVVVP